MNSLRATLAGCLGVLMSVGAMAGAQTGVQLFPKNKAVRVNPDTHLVLTFSSAVTVGKAGQIRVYDAADHRLVDTLDMSVPAGPDPARRISSPAASVIDPNPPTPTTTTPAVKTTPADLHSYQLNTIGGLADFHFYPVILHGATATIALHNNVLTYHHRYVVQMDAGVLVPADGSFSGFADDKSWSFATKPAPPSVAMTRLVVAADGSGDFNTVQGAADFVPDHPAARITIFIRNGRYEEIVFFQKKADLTFQGEDREKVQIEYANNSAFNPPMPGPSRRCAFSVYDSTGIVLENFSVSNLIRGQAEGLLVFGERNVVRRVNIKGSGDALNLRGSVYFEDSKIVGDGDTILGVGPAFFKRCTIESMGPFMWIRNTEANHGNVFVDCTFKVRERTGPLPPAPAAPAPGAVAPLVILPWLARLPVNHGINYPYAEAVLIDCKLIGLPAVGWGPVEGDASHVHLWEFHSVDGNGKPVDVSERLAASKQLNAADDAETIAQYRDPAFVLGGWKPPVDVGNHSGNP